MANVAIIPARGGSKRIPRKNIKAFLNKPIIAYTIEAALQSNLFDEVMVSTDDDEIAEVAIKYGAKIPFKRSIENANDFAGTAEVVLEVLACYLQSNISFNYACCLYPTAPFVNETMLQTSLEELRTKKYSSVFPVCQFSYPIQRSLKEKNGNIQMIWPENLNKRSQDLEPSYHDAGQFYWLNVDDFLIEQKLFMKNSGCIILDELVVQDIDNEMDWKLAELKYNLINQRS